MVIGGSVAALLAVGIGTTVALSVPGGSGHSPGTSGSAGPRTGYPLPPVTVYALGKVVTPISAATDAPGQTIPIDDASDVLWQSGSSVVALAKTARGLIAYFPAGGKKVVPVNVATGAAGTPISWGVLPGAIAYTPALAADPNGSIVYVIVSGGNSAPGFVVPIDTATDTARKPISVGVRPGAIAFTPNGKFAFVANEGDDTVTPINVATGTAGTPIHARLGSSGLNILFTPDSRTAYVPGDSEVTVIDVAAGTVAATIPVRASTLAITPDGSKIYGLVNGSLTPIDTATNGAGTSLVVAGGELVMAPNGKTVYVLDPEGYVTPIDVATGAPGTSVTYAPKGNGNANDMAITPDGKTIWIADYTNREMVPYDTATATMGTPVKIAGSGAPSQVVIAP
jgi:DNA-binding beta-propeller fold protein YncE